MKKFFFFIFLILMWAFLFRREVCGAFLEGRLSDLLSNVFGMPVMIEGLRVDPLNGHVEATHVRFMNQPEYSPGPHFEVSGLKFDVQYWAIRNKDVLIGSVDVEKPVFIMESIPQGKDDSVSNVWTWYHHIRVKFNLDAPDEGPPDPHEKRWHVKIGKINIHNGIFLYRNDRKNRRFYFANLTGSLAGFDRPTDPDTLPQSLDVAGTFGQDPPAPVWVKGTANFATSDVGFELDGEIHDGSVPEQKMFLRGLPVKITSGTYQLKTRLHCRRRILKAENQLDIKGIKARTMATPESVVWGVPVLGFVGLLQKETVIHLEPQVSGNISDPEFGFARAFRVAFRKALRHHTTVGFKMMEAPVKKMAPVMEAPAKMMEAFVKNLTPSPAEEKKAEEKALQEGNGHG